MKETEQYLDSNTLRLNGTSEADNMTLYMGSSEIAQRGYRENGVIHFEDPNDVFKERLYTLTPADFFTDMSFSVYDDEVLSDAVMLLANITVIDREIGFRVYISSDQVVEHSKCHPNAFMESLKQSLPPYMTIRDDYSSGSPSDAECSISFVRTYPFINSINDHIDEFRDEVIALMQKVKLQLTGRSWREEWNADERLFSKELIEPLLRAMKYDAVRNIHGSGEFGKDILCREFDKFGTERWLGIQLKAGDITGEVNSIVDVIIGQINDAFAIPFEDGASRSLKRISLFYVMCSGRITDNARTKIWSKIPNNLVGSVTFLDRQDLEGLIERHLTAKSR